MAEEIKTPMVGADGNTNLDGPIIFQCSKCNSVLGDSTAWVCARDELRTISLSKVTQNVLMGKSLVTSTDTEDLGSTYIRLRCASCKEEVGKVYQTTSPKLDNIRSIFTFMAKNLVSYVVGSMSVVAETDMKDVLDLPSSLVLTAQLRKVQSMIVMINDRVTALESCFEPVENDENIAENAQNQSRTSQTARLQDANHRNQSPNHVKKIKANTELVRSSAKRKKLE